MAGQLEGSACDRILPRLAKSVLLIFSTMGRGVNYWPNLCSSKYQGSGRSSPSRAPSPAPHRSNSTKQTPRGNFLFARTTPVLRNRHVSKVFCFMVNCCSGSFQTAKRSRRGQKHESLDIHPPSFIFSCHLSVMSIVFSISIVLIVDFFSGESPPCLSRAQTSPTVFLEKDLEEFRQIPHPWWFTWSSPSFPAHSDSK